MASSRRPAHYIRKRLCLDRTIPGATPTILHGVSHFAPLQRPARFNAAMLAFLDRLPG